MVTFELPEDILQYTKVCGRIKAYQFGTPDAFGAAYTNLSFSVGVSVVLIYDYFPARSSTGMSEFFQNTGS